MAGQRRAARIGDTASSTIESIAVGEVRVSGLVVPAELTLASPIQSRDCVWYRARVDEDEGRYERTILDEERAVGFRVKDGSGDLRVFPRGAQWLVPEAFDERSGLMGEQPVGLQLRSGSAVQPGFADRETQIAELLTVHPPAPDLDLDLDPGGGSFGGGLLGGGLLGGQGRRRYRESRVEPGDIVTVVGMALPFDQLPDPSGADAGDGAILDPAGAAIDPEVAADLAEARAAGTLAVDPEDAWGNAAIPGFGIGRPVRAPELDPAANALPIGTAAEAERAERTFSIAPGTLVLASTPDVGLLISLGAPAQAEAAQESRFLVGLLGAVLAIGSAVVLAIALTGGFGR